jgi:hypothetical protein
MRIIDVFSAVLWLLHHAAVSGTDKGECPPVSDT